MEITLNNIFGIIKDVFELFISLIKVFFDWLLNAWSRTKPSLLFTTRSSLPYNFCFSLLLIMTFIMKIVITTAALIYIIRMWNSAKLKRDIYESLHPRQRVGARKKKLSAIPFIFK